MWQFSVSYGAEDGIYFAKIVGMPSWTLVGESLEEVEELAQRQIEWMVQNLTADGMPIDCPGELKANIDHDCWCVMRA